MIQNWFLTFFGKDIGTVIMAGLGTVFVTVCLITTLRIIWWGINKADK